jgi:hypothetical protein
MKGLAKLMGLLLSPVVWFTNGTLTSYLITLVVRLVIVFMIFKYSKDIVNDNINSIGAFFVSLLVGIDILIILGLICLIGNLYLKVKSIVSFRWAILSHNRFQFL